MPPDQPNAKSDQLKKQADLLTLTMDAVFTEEQAKEVVQGKITDAYLVKMKLDIDNNSGMLLILASSIKKSILEIYAVVGNATIYRRLRPFADYAQVSQDLADIGKAKARDKGLSDNIGRTLYRILTKDKIEEFMQLWQKKDPSRLAETVEPAIAAATKAGRVKIQAEVDKISSARFRYQNPMIGLISPIELPTEETGQAQANNQGATLDLTNLQSPDGEKTPVQRQIDHFRKGYTKEIAVKTMISPVNGVDFDNLVEGQMIHFQIPADTPEGKANAAMLGMLDPEGKVSKEPLIAKFLGIASTKGEYHLFAEGPDRLLFHSQEESPVRVGVPNAAAIASSEAKFAASSSSRSARPVDYEENNTGLIIGLGAVMCILGAIAYVLLG